LGLTVVVFGGLFQALSEVQEDLFDPLDTIRVVVQVLQGVEQRGLALGDLRLDVAHQVLLELVALQELQRQLNARKTLGELRLELSVELSEARNLLGSQTSAYE
jgi:hypothetical protein